MKRHLSSESEWERKDESLTAKTDSNHDLFIISEADIIRSWNKVRYMIEMLLRLRRSPKAH